MDKADVLEYYEQSVRSVQLECVGHGGLKTGGILPWLPCCAGCCPGSTVACLAACGTLVASAAARSPAPVRPPSPLACRYYLPAVLRVRRHRSLPRHAQAVTLNRANIMLRDRYSCQYCGSSRDLTIDHVVPQVWPPSCTVVPTDARLMGGCRRISTRASEPLQHAVCRARAAATRGPTL
jgi:5-methylcytosine-specific restriction endonuclease McrA